ncbi:MAG: hypothetical protein K2K45_07655 [Muribaculaceae bacterium]|nr:hypothetical protein [Muribaculaceae bacterium]
MTQEEFKEQGWTVGMKVQILSGCWEGNTFDVVSVDFDQFLIGVYAWSEEEISWFRCENCKIVEQ